MAKSLSKKKNEGRNEGLKTFKKQKADKIEKKLSVRDASIQLNNVEDKKKNDSKEFYNKRKAENQAKEKYQNMYAEMQRDKFDVNSIKLKDCYFAGTYLLKRNINNFMKGQLFMVYSIANKKPEYSTDKVVCISGDNRRMLVEFGNLRSNLFKINK